MNCFRWDNEGSFLCNFYRKRIKYKSDSFLNFFSLLAIKRKKLFFPKKTFWHSFCSYYNANLIVGLYDN